MRRSHTGKLIVPICLIAVFVTACNMPDQGGSGGGIPVATMNEEEEEWLGEEKPTPTPHAGKVGSGEMHIDGGVSGLGAELESSVVVPFTIYKTEEGAYQVLGSSNLGILRVDLVGSGCGCDGDYELTSEINGKIIGTDTGGCQIEFSETRTFGTGDCDCDCPGDTISCEDAFTDIEELGPFIIDFYDGAEHHETGENNGVVFNSSWVLKGVKFNSDDCFLPDVINSSP